ncbi:molecular chaperone [Pseudomonas canadensis]|uniref:fimbrial biogenesis chaperone n=1 Tax=Pseudomonas canadensis TaxID=915099 RepID=UPI003B9FFB11
MKVRTLFKALLVAGAVALNVPVSHAAEGNGGVLLGGTRLIFDGAKDAASMTVTNSAAKDVWLMRFWVSHYDNEANDGADDKQPLPFAVTPPLYRLDPKAAVQLRVNKLSDTLPVDRESVYYLNHLAIPPKKGERSYQKAVQSGLQFAVNTRIKLFYRPEAINDSSAVKAAPDKLVVTSTDKTMLLRNPTPYFINLSQLTVDEKPVQTGKDTMVAPFGELSLPATVAHGTLTYSTIDDRGMTTSVLKKQF